MAHVNATRCGEFAQKKVKRVMAVVVDDALFADNGLSIATNNFLVANLPVDAVLTAAYVTVRTASDAATTATVQLGTTEAGAEILVATDITTVAVDGTIVEELDTGTGMPIYLRAVFAGAVTTVGETHVVIEYTEYTKNSGEYTQFS